MLIKALSSEKLERMRNRFNRLYGRQRADRCIERLAAMTGRYGIGYSPQPPPAPWNEQTAVLITYADIIRRAEEPPLSTLLHFAETHLEELFSTLHLLPFFPWSSDDGFSVIDYRQVDDRLGGWKQIRAFRPQFELMFDLVLNHVSRQSNWFKTGLTGVAPYRDYFIEADPDADLSAVVRPRSLPLLTPVRSNGSTRHFWTTFSDDQIDLNFANPDVLFEFLDLLLFYVSQGAKIIRLDAIAYLWKQPGTGCIHLEQTHEIIKLMRDFLEMAAPEVLLLTETNVPHEENISYFGTGDEAQLVYQFSLPPLLLHALLTQNSRFLTAWARTVCETPPGCTWFNFTASHDGIGVRPLAGLIPATELDSLIRHIRAQGGEVSVRRTADGSDLPYELNISWFDAMGGDAHQTARFLCSQTIMMALKGIPGVYFHSLTATPNDRAGFEATGRARSLNRKKWDAKELEAQLAGNGAAAAIFGEYSRRLKIRRRHAAFHPDAGQRILDPGNGLFGFVRTAAGESVFCISNLTGQPQELRPGLRISALSSAAPCTDLLSGRRFSGRDKLIPLEPYQTVWLTPDSS